MATPRFPPDLGGVEHHVAEVSRRLAADGFDVTVLTTGVERGLAPEAMVEGVRVLRARAWPRGHDAYLAPSLPQLLRRGGYDLVHLQSYHTLVAPLVMASALGLRRPFVVTFHGGGSSSGLRNRARSRQLTALGPLLRRARRLVAVARFEIEHYGRALGVGAERFAYIPNGADLPEITTALRPEPHLLVSIGRLERYKGHGRVIEALPAVLAEEPRARLWIAGSGPYEAELRLLADRVGVAERVEIRAVPPVERERYAGELARARVAILMSEFETHPIAALEASSLGLRLVVADSSGLAELVRDGLARGVRPDAPNEQLATAILSALRDETEPAAPLGLTTWDDCSARLGDLYRTVVHEARAGT